MEYDIDGFPKSKGKRRPNMPKTVTCHKCGKEVPKISYGTYGCENCHLSYQFSFGKLIRGSYDFDIKTIRYKNGKKVEKGEWTCGFLSQNGEHIDYPFSKI
ncbi:hypothetical protein [Clostridium butyricum]